MNLFGDLAGQFLGRQQGQGGAAGAILQMLGGQAGGIGGLAQLFQSKGLGDVVSSWIGTGANLPVSPDQLQNVLGSDRIGQIASMLGVSHEQAGSQLAGLLPGIVDGLTPNGQVPDSGTDLMSMGQNMLKGFLPK
jgi:uncharacterized protein YidB (DUF937 family)